MSRFSLAKKVADSPLKIGREWLMSIWYENMQGMFKSSGPPYFLDIFMAVG